ncbi:hypothetical protein J6590_045911 [Homalodisca vitripennis]|nr:hypothetical protein J6590_045911 [Homalodisca vitripennis]
MCEKDETRARERTQFREILISGLHRQEEIRQNCAMTVHEAVTERKSGFGMSPGDSFTALVGYRLPLREPPINKPCPTMSYGDSVIYSVSAASMDASGLQLCEPWALPVSHL